MTAADALAAGDFDDGLRQLLAMWDHHRSPELAAFIEGVSAHVTNLLPPLEPGESREHLAAWIALARAHEPSDVGRLLAKIKLPVLLASGLISMADELLTLPPDPRIAALCAKLVEPDALRYAGGPGDKVFTRACKGLELHADPRLTKAIDRTSNDPYYARTPHQRRLGGLAAAWRKRWPTPPDEPAELAALRAVALPSAITAIAKPPRDADSLLAEIYARPDDDGPRLVYADLLAERGDPRAELITLQLARAAGRGTPAGDKREAALLREHKTAWLGPLAGSVVVGRTEWARGFPVATRPSVTKQAQAESAFGRREWATFERIDFGGACLITEAMRGLRAAHNVTEVALRKLAGTPPLAELAVELDRGRELRVSQPTIALALKLPELRTLTLASPLWRGGDALPAFVAAVAPRLAHLAVHGEGIPDDAITAVLAANASGLASFGWGVPGARFVVTRDGSGALSKPVKQASR
jgi:uncharacterized protein (TIGR02996 family)|nr:TIGR02996 domain-containing protein [Kofleriaceae bacterium]